MIVCSNFWRRARWLLLVSIFALPESVRGAQIYQVAEDGSRWIITQEAPRPWGVGDPVVVRRQDVVLALGVVEAANESAGLVVVSRRGAVAIVAGDTVEYARDSSQIIEVLTDGSEFWVSHPVNAPWGLGSAVCVARGELTVGCGRIVEVAEERGRLQLAGATAWVVVGDFVRAAFLETRIISVDTSQQLLRFRQGVFEKWRVGERACAVDGSRELACGTLTEANEQFASLKSDRSVDAVVPGTLVRGKPRTSFVYQVAGDQKTIIVTHHQGASWVQGDTICAQRMGYEIACGTVVQSNLLAALVEIKTVSDYPVAVGDQIRGVGTGNPEVLKKPKGERGESAPPVVEEPDEFVPQSAPASEAGVDPAVHRFGNVVVGVNYVFPGFRYEQSIGSHFAVGLGAMLVSYPTGGGQLKGTGFLGNISFYEAGGFQGMWIFGGGGILNLKASLNGVESNLNSFLLSVGTGWRWRWDSGINFGFAVGLNYLTKVKTPDVALDTSNLLPSILMDIGFSF